MRPRAALWGISLLTLAGAAGAQAPPSVPFDHVHLGVPDPQAAYAWYVQYLDGRPAEFATRVAFDAWPAQPPLPVQILFNRTPDAPPSEGGSIARLGFSYADIDAKARGLQAAGVTFLGSRTFKDPWGTSIELVNDPQLRGFHHVVLSVPDVAGTLKWYALAFGGARVKLPGLGQLEALRYGNMYLAAVTGQGAPSRGRAIDHISWGPGDINQSVAGVAALAGKVTAAVAGPNTFGHHTAFVEDANGVAIELVQHDEFLKKP